MIIPADFSCKFYLDSVKNPFHAKKCELQGLYNIYYLTDLVKEDHFWVAGHGSRPDACPPFMRMVAGSILTSGKPFFH